MKHRLNLSLQGGFGNCLFQYAFAKAYALRHGFELCCNWPDGEALFQLDHSPGVEGFTRVSETHSINREAGVPWLVDIELRGYFQQQDALIYSRNEARSWFILRPDARRVLEAAPQRSKFYAHRRVGDYIGYGYVVVSRHSYEEAMRANGHPVDEFVWLHGYGLGQVPPPEHQARVIGLPDSLGFMRDFYCMMRAEVLYRGNSSFSWWAAVLGNALTYAPVIEGLGGGAEQHTHFVDGNWPRFANLDFVTDLHLKP